MTEIETIAKGLAELAYQQWEGTGYKSTRQEIAARLGIIEGLEIAAKIIDDVHKEMCGQHGVDSDAAGAAFYAAQAVRDYLKGQPC